MNKNKCICETEKIIMCTARVYGVSAVLHLSYANALGHVSSLAVKV